MKTAPAYLPDTHFALRILGSQVAIARRELGWTVTELAERVGCHISTITRIEGGAPGTAIGTVFEAAIICRVPLFSVSADELKTVDAIVGSHRALLPQRVHPSRIEIDDDF